jgi:hypothetical protein
MEKYGLSDNVEELQEHTVARVGKAPAAYRTFHRKNDGAWCWEPILKGPFNRRVPADVYASRAEAQAAAETWWGR